MKVVKVTLKDKFGDVEGHYVCERKDIDGVALFDEWDQAGMTYILELVEMPQEEFDTLPEFDGF